MKVHIETERFFIRDFELYDAENMLIMESDPEVHRFLGNKPVTALEKVIQIIKGVKKQYQEVGIGRWAIADKETNAFVGWTGFKLENKLRKDFTYYDLGYRLLRKHWGKGIGTEAANACVSYGFTNLNFTEIYAAAHTENIGSNKIIQKVGLKFIETFTFEDIVCNWYGLQKEEWLANT